MPPPPHLRARKPACEPHLIRGRLPVGHQGIQRPSLIASRYARLFSSGA